MRTISIAKDFSETPLGRFPSDGDYNGTRFREEFLKPALEGHDRLVVQIDGVEGYGSSFLEEAFGGLVRKGYFTAPTLRTKLELTYTDEDFRMYAELVRRYIDDARRE